MHEVRCSGDTLWSRRMCSNYRIHADSHSHNKYNTENRKRSQCAFVRNQNISPSLNRIVAIDDYLL
jgi:hypothetical protein